MMSLSTARYFTTEEYSIHYVVRCCFSSPSVKYGHGMIIYEMKNKELKVFSKF